MANLIEIKTSETFIVDMMYSGTSNMLKTDVYGRVGLGNRCFVQPDLYQNLQKLIPELQSRGLRLKIRDAYRPPLAHNMMLEIIPMPGFFARKPELSQHCHASAIDVILTDDKGQELDFPCAVDAYSPFYADEISAGRWDDFRHHLEKAKYTWNDPAAARAVANRDMLRRLMEQAGFTALEHEWWHFNLPDKEKYPLIDFSLRNGQPVFTEK